MNSGKKKLGYDTYAIFAFTFLGSVTNSSVVCERIYLLRKYFSAENTLLSNFLFLKNNVREQKGKICNKYFSSLRKNSFPAEIVSTKITLLELRWSHLHFISYLFSLEDNMGKQGQRAEAVTSKTI